MFFSSYNIEGKQMPEQAYEISLNNNKEKNTRGDEKSKE